MLSHTTHKKEALDAQAWFLASSSLLKKTSCMTWVHRVVCCVGGAQRAWSVESVVRQKTTAAWRCAVLCSVPKRWQDLHALLCRETAPTGTATTLTMPSTVAHAAMLRASPTDCWCTTTQYPVTSSDPMPVVTGSYRCYSTGNSTQIAHRGGGSV